MLLERQRERMAANPLGNAGDYGGVQMVDGKCCVCGVSAAVSCHPPDSARAGAAVLVSDLGAPRQGELALGTGWNT